MAPRSTAKRRKISLVWNYFSEQTKLTAKCNFCSKFISHRGSTFNLSRHLSLVHSAPTLPLDPLISAPTPLTTESHNNSDDLSIVLHSSNQPPIHEYQTLVTQPPSCLALKRKTHYKVRKTAIEPIATNFQKHLSGEKHQELNFTLVETFVKNYLPFQLVETPQFKKFIYMLNASYQLPTCKNISNELLPQIYKMTKEKVKTSLKGTTAVTLATDSWTSLNNKSYISVTAHFITKEMELKSCLLDCFKYDVTNPELNLATEIKKIALVWDVESKVVAIVSDNVENLVASIQLTDWKHIPCFAHNLNLIVQHGLQEIKDLQNKVKSLAEFFSRNPEASEKLNDIQKQLGEPILHLKQDIVSQWNSTYYMFYRIIQVKNALMLTVAVNYTQQDITNEDMTVIVEVCELLKVFMGCTEEMIRENQITASKIILLSQALMKWCKRFTDDPTKHILVKQMAVKLLEALNKHFDKIEENELFAEATALDPRFKRHGFTDEQRFENIKLALVAQVAEKIRIETEGASQLMTSTPEETKPILSMVWDDFDKSVTALEKNPDPEAAGIMEVNKYMEEPLLARNGNPLAWWFERRHVYPKLFEMSKKRLCLVGTSVPCNNFFSKAGQLINERRNSLSGKKVSEILFLNGNL